VIDRAFGVNVLRIQTIVAGSASQRATARHARVSIGHQLAVPGWSRRAVFVFHL